MNCIDKNVQKRYFLSFQYLFIDFVTIYLSSIIYNDHKNISVKYELQSTIFISRYSKKCDFGEFALVMPRAFIFERVHKQNH